MYSQNDWRSYRSDELCHFGILGMKWGIRRYQNPDGSLTDAGRAHYGRDSEREAKRQLKEERKREKKEHKELKKQERAKKVLSKIYDYEIKNNWVDIYNEASENYNKKIDAINAKYSKANLGQNFETKEGQKYVKEVGKMWMDEYSKAFDSKFNDLPEWYDFDKSTLPYFNTYDSFILKK